MQKKRESKAFAAFKAESNTQEASKRMANYYILDTNVLLHDPLALYKFEENHVFIPIVVVEEIDKFKRDPSETGRNARTVSRLLDQERSKGNLSEGVPLTDGGSLSIVLESDEIKFNIPFSTASKTNDNWILGVALHYNKIAAENNCRCVLVTKDANLRIKADALSIRAEDYSNDKVKVDELYNGWEERSVPAATLDKLEAEGSIPLLDDHLYANEFIRLVDEDDHERSVLARVPSDRDALLLLDEHIENVWGIEPLNLEQRMALELLLDPKVKLVSLQGKAGTGKTLLALAAGLQMVIDQNRYNRLLVSRPVHPLGKDLGYLPGDIDEKIRPWMQPIFDNLEYILHCNNDELTKSQITYQYFIDKGWMVVEPLTYMRGRSIPNQYVLIDEAQNLTPHEIKSIITRAGHGTKIVLTGDPEQIDHPFLDAMTNGISYLVKRLKNQSLYGHVALMKGERSDLAECASNLL